MSRVSSVRTPRWSVRHRERGLAGGSLLLLLFLYAPVFASGFAGRPHFWVWSELHINYAAGFVRRGLLGEIAYRVQGLTGLSTRAFFGSVFLAMTLLEIALLFRLLRPLRARPLVHCLLVLSPALVLFAAYDPGVYMRKDLFLAVGFLGHALLAQAVRQGNMTEHRYRRALALVVAPYLAVVILVHEAQWFFLPVHAVLIAAALGPSPRQLRLIVLVLLPPFVLGLVVMARRGDAQMAAIICESWAGRARVECGNWSGIGAVGWPLSWAVNLTVRVMDAPISLGIWAVAAALTAVPAVVLYAVLYPGGRPPRTHVVGFLAVVLPALPLFAIGWDWGRWLHLLAMGAVAVLLAGMPPTAPAAPRRPAWVAGIQAVGLALYLFAWYLPHSTLPENLAGGFGNQFPKALQFHLSAFRKVGRAPRPRDAEQHPAGQAGHSARPTRASQPAVLLQSGVPSQAA